MCAWDVRQTCLKRIQRACNPCGTYSKRISHTPGTRRASRKFLSMFKIFLIPNAHETLDDFQRHKATRAGCTPSVHNVLVTRFECVSNVCLAYVEFCNFFNTPGTRFTYTLMSDCCFTTVHSTLRKHVHAIYRDFLSSKTLQ